MEEGGKVQDLSEQWCSQAAHRRQETSVNELVSVGLSLPGVQEASELRDNLA